MDFIIPTGRAVSIGVREHWPRHGQWSVPRPRISYIVAIHRSIMMIVHSSRRVALVAIFISAVFDPNTARGQDAELRRGNPPPYIPCEFYGKTWNGRICAEGGRVFRGGDFRIAYGQNGLRGVSDSTWMNTVPRFKSYLEIAGRKIASRLGKDQTLVLFVSKNGVISSSNSSIVKEGSSASTFLIEYGDALKGQPAFSATLTSDGKLTFSNEAELRSYPQLVERVSRYRAQLAVERPRKATVLKQGATGVLLVVGPSGDVPAETSFWDEFKACVGEYWWAPGVAQVACGIGAAIMS